MPNLPITNGQQVTTGSCNPAPMGVIAANTNMPSSKFTFPANGQTIPANQDFSISMALLHLQAGNFVNAEENYFAAPQTVNAQGDIIGHTHFVVEPLQALDQTTPLDPTKFTFFKGVNTAAAANGEVSVDVAGGLKAGVYRLASINTATNHQPVLVSVAQHGSVDDMVYFTVSDDAAAAGGAAGGAGGAAASAAAPPAASASAAAGGNNANNGKGGAAAPPPAKGGNNGKGQQQQQQQQKGGKGGKGGRRFRRAVIAREY